MFQDDHGLQVYEAEIVNWLEFRHIGYARLKDLEEDVILSEGCFQAIQPGNAHPLFTGDREYVAKGQQRYLRFEIPDRRTRVVLHLPEGKPEPGMKRRATAWSLMRYWTSNQRFASAPETANAR